MRKIRRGAPSKVGCSKGGGEKMEGKKIKKVALCETQVRGKGSQGGREDHEVWATRNKKSQKNQGRKGGELSAGRGPPGSIRGASLIERTPLTSKEEDHSFLGVDTKGSRREAL